MKLKNIIYLSIILFSFETFAAYIHPQAGESHVAGQTYISNEHPYPTMLTFYSDLTVSVTRANLGHPMGIHTFNGNCHGYIEVYWHRGGVSGEPIFVGNISPWMGTIAKISTHNPKLLIIMT